MSPKLQISLFLCCLVPCVFLPFAILGFSENSSYLVTPPISEPPQPPTLGKMPCIIYWFPCKSPRGVHGTHYSVCTPRGDFVISAFSSRTIAFSVEILIFQHHHKDDFISRPSFSTNFCMKTQRTCKTTKEPTCLERVQPATRFPAGRIFHTNQLHKTHLDAVSTPPTGPSNPCAETTTTHHIHIHK